MASSLLDDPEHWRGRAEEATRSVADQLSDAESKRMMLRIVADYERLAEHTKRQVVAFSFGLLHGFGFASALTDIGLPQGDVPLALLPSTSA